MATTYTLNRNLSVIANNKSVYNFNLIGYDSTTKSKIVEYGPFANVIEVNSFCKINNIPFSVAVPTQVIPKPTTQVPSTPIPNTNAKIDTQLPPKP